MANFDLQFNAGEDNRVHVPRIAPKRATYQSFRLALRNTVLFRSSKLHFAVLELFHGNRQCFGICVVCSVTQQKCTHFGMYSI